MSRIQIALMMKLTLLVAIALLSCGCGRSTDTAADVVLYTSVDEPAARPVIDAFEKKTGHKVRLVADTEATRSVGLAERLRAEKGRPKADVWWGNEPFLTVALADEGLLQPYQPKTVAGVRPQFVDKQHRWTGNGLRARVLVEHGTSSDARNLTDLLDPKFKGQVVIARPTAGTTASHFAALYTLWGREKADEFCAKLHENGVALVAGNSIAAQQVGAGNFLLGLTDNDDVTNAREATLDATAILPDQGDGETGTLTLPTTVGLVANRPDSPAAKELVDFLASREAERMLIDGQFVAYSVRDDGTGIRSMEVDYKAVADALPEAVRRATALLEGRQP